jgi:hypothetical protein
VIKPSLGVRVARQTRALEQPGHLVCEDRGASTRVGELLEFGQRGITSVVIKVHHGGGPWVGAYREHVRPADKVGGDGGRAGGGVKSTLMTPRPLTHVSTL